MNIPFQMEPGGWLLLSFLYFFADAEGLLVVLGNILVHEYGHLLALRRFRARIRGIRFGLTGLCIDYHGLYLSHTQQMLASLAGPAAGLSVAVLASILGNLLDAELLQLFAGVGVALNGFNLLPAKPLDGWGALHTICPRLAERVSAVTAGLVLAAGLYLMLRGFGTALAFMGLALVMQGFPEKSGKKPRISPGRGVSVLPKWKSWGKITKTKM